MANCVSNEPNYSGGEHSTASSGSKLGGYSSGTSETAYGYTVDFSGNWGYNASAVSSNSKANTYKEGFKKIGDAIGMDWRLAAAVAMQESQFNPKAVNGNMVGLFQFSKAAWTDNAPKGKKDLSYRIDVGAQYDATINLWSKLSNRFKNISNLNDKLALIIQSHHDGPVTVKDGVQWKDYVEKYSADKQPSARTESIKYLQLVIGKYRQLCK
jgi:soluble lytic murein transglycosylase-like protein